MKLLPSRSFVRPWHRQSLKNLEEDLAWAGKRKVDLDSGAMLIVDREDQDNWDWSQVDGSSEFAEEYEALRQFNER